LGIGNEMWNYLSRADKIVRIPPSMMMRSWMGSDFTNNDLVREFTFAEDYDFHYTSVKNPDPGNPYIKCVPEEGKPIVWVHVLLEIDSESLLPKTEK